MRIIWRRKSKEKEKQVRANNDAASPCNFLFNSLFILLDLAIDFAIFTMWLQMYGWTLDRLIDGIIDRQTE